MFDVGAISYTLGALGFLGLTLVLLTGWRGRLHGGLLVAAASLSAIWAFYAAYKSAMGATADTIGILSIEVLRNAAWFVFVLAVLQYAESESSPKQRRRFLSRFGAAVLMFSGLLLLITLISAFLDVGSPLALVFDQVRGAGFVASAVVGLSLVEQLFRHARTDRRWGIKYLCFGLGAMFGFDFYLFADALLFSSIDVALWEARGVVSVMIVPLIAVSAARNPQWSLDVFVSRGMVFHTAALLGTGTYLVLMAAAGFYLQRFGGEWGGVLQASFLLGALVVLLVLFFSGHVRARLRVFVSKHFFNYKYDYREEWLRFTRTMSDQFGDSVGERAIQALCQIVDSPAGVLWLRRTDGGFYPHTAWNTTYRGDEMVSASDSFTRLLAEREWVIDVDEFGLTPELYGALEMPDWVFRLKGRFVVPLMRENDLLGFVLLIEPRAQLIFNWEDSDLLKTVGRQVAIFLAQWEADQALNESRQFEAYTRMSTFLVHDLKNMAGQLTLILRNAEKHKSNPAFVDDMLLTVENSATKMGRLLDQLRTGRIAGAQQVFDIARAVSSAIVAKSSGYPVPTLESGNESCLIRADKDRFVSVLGHLIQNAQDATEREGASVMLRLHPEDDHVILTVEDNGSGMDAEFINHRLFQPFYSTKGASGMGIGAYDARQFVRQLGGELSVSSSSGQGTTMTLKLPVVQVEDE